MKAILILNEMPKNCGKCKFYDGYECYASGEKMWEGLSFKVVEDWEKKPNWCPLKPMPKIKDVDFYRNVDRDYGIWVEGWNDCLKEIEE